jgi:hypothetical protein
LHLERTERCAFAAGADRADAQHVTSQECQKLSILREAGQDGFARAVGHVAGAGDLQDLADRFMPIGTCANWTWAIGNCCCKFDQRRMSQRGIKVTQHAAHLAAGHV